MSPRCISRRVLTLLAALGVAALTALLGRGPDTPAADAEPAKGALTSRPRPATPPADALYPGTLVLTSAGEGRRVVLPEGSVLFLNEKTAVRLAGIKLLVLSRGEIYLETAAGDVTVQAAGGEVVGKQASFSVRVEKAGPAVGVVRGKVAVKGLAKVLHAGQRLAAGAEAAEAAPRASHALGWLRDLVCAADAALLPANPQAGGALVAIDPNGQEAKLTLRRFHVDVHIEDGFARTTIDQTYFNHHGAQLEGTFYFPLPADASLSRLAMYVNGQLMEGGMAEREHARNVYETIRYMRKDPALLEWVDGSTFKMRVFPLEPRQEKRIVLSFSQRLDSLYGKSTYRFPAGHTLQKVRDWSFQARVKDGAGWPWDSPSHKLQAQEEKKDLLLSGAATDAATNRDIVLSLVDPRGSDQLEEFVQFATADHEGAKYLLTRYRPRLAGKTAAERRDWVFLVETSGDRDPLLARVQIEVLRHLLMHAEPDDTFAVLAAGTRVTPFSKEPLPVTAENIQAAAAFLESAHLIGALDLGQALTESAAFLKKGSDPHLVHLGSGVAAMGERRDDVLARRVPDGAKYIGIGVGRKWNRSLMKLAAERSGGHFTQINPDEPLAWRSFELLATINTPRLMDVEVVDKAGKAKFLAFNQAVAQGEEIAAVTRVEATLPTTVVIRGTLDGKKFERELPVKNATPQAAYLPRTWAKLEIGRLLADDPVKHKDAIIALSKSMYVITPYTSLLVLENEDQYVQYKVDRGRKDHWALYPLPEKIPVVAEPDPDAVEAKAGKLPAKQVLQTIAGPIWKTVEVPQGNSEAIAADLGRMFTNIRIRTMGKSRLLVRATPEDHSMIRVLMSPMSRSVSAGAPTLSTVPYLDRLFRNVGIGGGADTDGGIVRSTGPSRFADISVPTADLGVSRTVPGQIAGMRAQQLSMGVFAPPVFPVNYQLRSLPEFQRESLAGTAMDQLGRIRGRMAKLDGSLMEMDKDAFLSHLDFDPAVPVYDPAATKSKDKTMFVMNLLPLARFEMRSTAPRAKSQAADVAFLNLLAQIEEMPNRGPIYERPTYLPSADVYHDLVAYAPGLNTSLADVEAVLEAEAISGKWNKSGKIDPAARELLAKSQSKGWQSLTLPVEQGQPGFTVFFDATGRFAYTRELPFGLRERVVCDGKTLMHLYPQLALAARRDVSRFHRADLASLVPWFVPAADELARGADVTLVKERTVAIVPHGVAGLKKDAHYYVVHLVFADNGQLAERRVVKMPSGEVVYRLVLSADGTARLLDAKDKELVVRKGTLARAVAPALTADTKNLLVLPLPYRTADYVGEQLKLDKRGTADLSLKEALPLFLAHIAAGDGSRADQLFRQVFHAREQRQLGFYVLLASCGINLDADHGNVLAEHESDPLAQYLALHTSPVLRKHASQWAVGGASWQDPFLQHLAVTHAYLQRWQNDRVLGDPKRAALETERAIDFVKQKRESLFGYAMLCLIQDRAKDDKTLHAKLAELWPLFEKQPGLAFAARFETARSLWKAGKQDEARQRFRALYEAAIKDDALPAVDADMRAALLAGDAWGDLLRKTARQLIEQKRRPAILAIARQCWDLDDQPLAGELVALSLDGIADPAERTAMALAAFDFMRDTHQLPEADGVLQGLLGDPKLARQSLLWRLASELAKQRDMDARAIECLEKALDIEAEQPPPVIDLEMVRADYGALLTHYQRLADAMVALKLSPPPDFLSRVIRAADRWRAVDNDPSNACDAAAKILKRLGARELAWEYLTTPIGLHPNEAAPWTRLATGLGTLGELELADRAYRAAAEAEPTDAQLLWDRAQNLKQLGKHQEAQQLVRQIADGVWQPRFQGLQSQARHLLKRE